jgi:tetratricopeptide (TPR) repeat protein
VHALETARKTPSRDQTGLLFGAAYVAIRTGDYADAERRGEQALELGRARGDAPVIARSLVGLAMAVEQQSEHERARTLYLEATDVAEECGETWIPPVVAYNVAEIALIEGDMETARTHFQRTLELTRALTDPGGEAFALLGLSFVALARRDSDEAGHLLGRSLRLARDVRAKELIYAGLLGSAEVAVQGGETARAVRLLGATDALREEMGYTPSRLEQAQRTRIATLVDGDDATLIAAQSGEHALTLDEAVAYALENTD